MPTTQKLRLKSPSTRIEGREPSGPEFSPVSRGPTHLVGVSIRPAGYSTTGTAAAPDDGNWASRGRGHSRGHRVAGRRHAYRDAIGRVGYPTTGAAAEIAEPNGWLGRGLLKPSDRGAYGGTGSFRSPKASREVAGRAATATRKRPELRSSSGSNPTRPSCQHRAKAGEETS